MTQAAKKQSAPLRVSKGISPKPDRIILYGPEGVGKSSLAADYGDGRVVVIDVEGGTDKIDTDRYVFDDTGRTRPSSLAEIYMALRALYDAQHDYSAVVLDGADELQRLIWEQLISKARPDKQGNKPTSIEHIGGGYGKGFTMAVEEWRRLASALEKLRSHRNLAVIIVAHSQVRSYKNPLGDDFDRFTLLLHKDASSFLQGWADIVGFMQFEDHVSEKPSDRDKKIGKDFGVRNLHLNRSAAFDAKSRGDHPDKVAIPKKRPWSAITEALKGNSK